MKLEGGYTKKVLKIDLDRGKTKVFEVSDSFALKYVGGRGWGARMVWERYVNETGSYTLMRDRALSPENIIVIAPGPLSGLYLPASGKTSMVSISPATGIYADSNFGGMWGVELRQAGYDAITISGRAEKLSYIFINDENVEIRDAGDYTGKGCIETERGIKEEIGDEEVRVAVIGPAGENVVRFACINSDWSRNAGRTGMGAVFGSKNLKAIAVQGSHDLPVADLDSLIEIGNEAYDYLKNHFLFELWQKQGLMSVVDYVNTLGVMPTHNYTDGYFERGEDINGEVMENKHKIGDTACFACPMACGNICLVKEGKYVGTVTEGPEYETACLFGSNLGIGNFSCILKANQLCDNMGIDTITTANLIGAVIEGYEKGILSEEEIGFSIGWGDEDGILSLIEKIARREGIGNVLAEGAYGVIKKWEKMERIISHVKGLEQTGYDARVSLCMALAYGTADIGAHHNRAWPLAKELEMGKDWDLGEKVDLVIYHQTVRPLFDMLGVCRLPWIELGMSEEIYAKAYTAATGVKTSLKDLLKRSEMVYNLTRAINVKFGIRREHDYPPERVFEDPLKTGPNAGKILEREKYEAALDLYYEKRGWERETGIPTREKLIECGLEDVAEIIHPE
ncbi:MAG: aldehyde ferredoxin oxidoreductase family protein [Candidatus Syntropharchaeia archaeon]